MTDTLAAQAGLSLPFSVQDILHGLLGISSNQIFKHAIDVVRGKFDEEGAKGDTSHFQSLATALSGTVGTGNIAGVAFAYLGGRLHFFGCW